MTGRGISACHARPEQGRLTHSDVCSAGHQRRSNHTPNATERDSLAAAQLVTGDSDGRAPEPSSSLVHRDNGAGEGGVGVVEVVQEGTEGQTGRDDARVT